MPRKAASKSKKVPKPGKLPAEREPPTVPQAAPNVWTPREQAQVAAAALSNPVLVGGALLGAGAIALRLSGRSLVGELRRAWRADVGAKKEIAAAGASKQEFKAPVFDAPSYTGPTFQAPTFTGPTFQAPTFTGPTFQAPTFTAPTFQAPTFTGPTFQAPTFTPPTYPSWNPPGAAPGAGEPPAGAPEAQTTAVRPFLTGLGKGDESSVSSFTLYVISKGVNPQRMPVPGAAVHPNAGDLYNDWTASRAPPAPPAQPSRWYFREGGAWYYVDGAPPSDKPAQSFLPAGETARPWPGATSTAPPYFGENPEVYKFKAKPAKPVVIGTVERKVDPEVQKFRMARGLPANPAVDVVFDPLSYPGSEAPPGSWVSATFELLGNGTREVVIGTSGALVGSWEAVPATLGETVEAVGGYVSGFAGKPTADEALKIATFLKSIKFKETDSPSFEIGRSIPKSAVNLLFGG